VHEVLNEEYKRSNVQRQSNVQKRDTKQCDANIVQNENKYASALCVCVCVCIVGMYVCVCAYVCMYVCMYELFNTVVKCYNNSESVL